MSIETNSVFRQEALRRYAASRQSQEPLLDVPARLLVILWLLALLCVAGLLGVALHVG